MINVEVQEEEKKKKNNSSKRFLGRRTANRLDERFGGD